MKLLKFELPTCGPCKVLNETLKNAKVKFEVVDCSKNEELVQKYNISHVPILVKLNENDEVVDTCKEIVMNDTLSKFLEDVDTY